MSKQRLLELAEYCHTNGAVHGEVNDRVYIENLEHVNEEVLQLTSFSNFRKMLKYYRDTLVYKKEVAQIEVRKKKYTPPNNGESFYDSVDMSKLAL